MKELQPHIRCSSEVGAKYAIIPGDPKRVDRIKGFLEQPQEITFNREYKSVVGFYKGVRVMATSTGIGGPSAAIAVEELKKIGVETMIRIGSCGALQPGMKLGELVLATGAVRDDGASATYIQKTYPAVSNPEVLFALIKCAKELGYKYRTGIVRSHDSFYTDDADAVDDFWSKKGLVGSDMETATLFVVGGLRGIKTGSILNTVVEYAGNLEAGINNYVNGENEADLGEQREILNALEAILYLDNEARKL